MEDTPPERAKWIVYMQPETFFDDTTFAIPFDSYRDKDLVLIGNQTALRDGKMRGAQAAALHSTAVHPDYVPSLLPVQTKDFS